MGKRRGREFGGGLNIRVLQVVRACAVADAVRRASGRLPSLCATVRRRDGNREDGVEAAQSRLGQ